MKTSAQRKAITASNILKYSSGFKRVNLWSAAEVEVKMEVEVETTFRRSDQQKERLIINFKRIMNLDLDKALYCSLFLSKTSVVGAKSHTSFCTFTVQFVGSFWTVWFNNRY